MMFRRPCSSHSVHFIVLGLIAIVHTSPALEGNDCEDAACGTGINVLLQLHNEFEEFEPTCQDGWGVCAHEGETCDRCGSGMVRFGDAGEDIWAYTQLRDGISTIPCSSHNFGSVDPMPGRVKSCQCCGNKQSSSNQWHLDTCTGRRQQSQSSSWPEMPQLHIEKRANLTTNDPKGSWPLLSCAKSSYKKHASLGADQSKNNANAQQAVETFCNADLGSLVEFHVDPEFAGNFKRLLDAHGWIPRAYVTYMGISDTDETFAREVDLLVQSVHYFSKYPIVVTNFGEWVPKAWTSKRFPNMVLVHGSPMKTGRSFNFNKLRAMMFTKVQTGILVDADQWVNKGMDTMFQRTEEECTSVYPFPIMPVHWMARDPDSDDGYAYTFRFDTAPNPARTMRWGHAHPTWTHHAFGFLAKWTTYVLQPERQGTPDFIRGQGSWEDEDLLNVGLWAENATKQWCKFDIPGYEDYQMYHHPRDLGDAKLCPDTKWYPDGIAFLFYSAHAAKEPQKTKECLHDLFLETEDKPRILYNGSWFKTGTALKEYDPKLRCLA
eukprot:TRINITY_DN44535_c0_g1_i1.p1 TRINITY_DN44535_c0_g1~~TRINITY_DN44535_c0_g1_i1.p1  ORF type:complete len:548 (-),score=77.37 TRINITY_DN44535_c0_g1_i1:162-1805(-)